MTNENERFIRELILQWKLGRVNQKTFVDKFGISISERFSSILLEWEKKGDLTVNGDEFLLSRDALLRVDSLLQGFFLPQHQEARYV
jgi:hypothetical protein